MRIGLLGAARIAPHAVIGPAVRSGFAEVVAVAARDETRARAFAAEHGVPEVEPDYAALIARDDLDLVYVGLPNSAHAPWSIRAVERGHAVLCEKPFATRSAEVEAMVAAGRKAGAPLLEAFHYRHHPLMHALVDMARGGALGAIVKAEASFVTDAPRSDPVRWSAALGGGALLDLGCYAVHALRSILGGEPEVLSADAVWVDDVDARLTGQLVFPGGVEAVIACDMTADRPAANLRLVGERGEVRVENYIAPQRPHRMVVSDDKGERELRFDGPGTFDHQLEHVRAVMAGEAVPLVGGDDALAQMAALDRLYQAAGRPD